VAGANSTPLRVAVYARVSTVGNGQSPEMQLRELREFCSLRGWDIFGEFTDHVSGAKESRPALNQLIAAASQRKFDVLLCWKLDRVGRSLRHLVNLLAELEALGISFVSLRDNLDLTTPSGRLMFHVIAAMAQFERSLISERVKAGLRNAAAKGIHIGRPKVTADASRIRALRAAGASWATVCRETGFSKGTAQRAFYSLPKSV
jgi:DNA invertase Pin-like site-specific DNA recombinase